ncbi:IS6 family transposase [bacterium AH-315-O15]|nr:IS6 family transposase [bacterium AH-315-O15]
MSPAASYCGYRLPPEIISHAAWLYHRFCLSFRDAEDLLARRGITVTLVQSRRDRGAAARFFRKLLKAQGRVPLRLITDKLGSYGAAHRAVMPSVAHSTKQYENNRAEVSHQPTWQMVRTDARISSLPKPCRTLAWPVCPSQGLLKDVA